MLKLDDDNWEIERGLASDTETMDENVAVDFSVKDLEFRLTHDLSKVLVYFNFLVSPQFFWWWNPVVTNFFSLRYIIQSSHNSEYFNFFSFCCHENNIVSQFIYEFPHLSNMFYSEYFLSQA